MFAIMKENQRNLQDKLERMSTLDPNVYGNLQRDVYQEVPWASLDRILILARQNEDKNANLCPEKHPMVNPSKP